MKRKWPLIGVAVLVTVLCASSLWPCEPGRRPRAGRSCASDAVAHRPPPQNSYDGGWGYPRCPSVCTYNAECYPWRSANGSYLLFASIDLSGPPRPGHQGAWDIYISEWDSLNQCWAEPVNPGPSVNTDLSERRPSCTADCDTIYFDRGGDLYMSTWDGEQCKDWGQVFVTPELSVWCLLESPILQS